MIHLPHIFMVVQPFEMDVSENASVYSAYLAQNNHSHASGKSVFFSHQWNGDIPIFQRKSSLDICFSVKTRTRILLSSGCRSLTWS